MAQQHLSLHSNLQHDAFHLQNQRAEPQHITNPPVCAGYPYSTVSPYPRIPLRGRDPAGSCCHLELGSSRAGRCGLLGVSTAPSSARRIALRRMPSIRQTLQEMGVKVSDVFPELRQRRGGAGGPQNGTAPTLLTNYLDVSSSPLTEFLLPHILPTSRVLSAAGGPTPSHSAGAVLLPDAVLR